MISRGVTGAMALGLAISASDTRAATLIVPGAYSSVDAPAAQFGILGNPSNSAGTYQFVVSNSELAGITTGSVISAIGFRFAGTPFLGQADAASYSRYDIQIGRAANSATSLSPTYASNMGSDTVLARTGAMTIAANSFVDLPGEGPNNFYDLGFPTPYTYAGGDLAVTIRYVPNAGSSAIAVDAFEPDARINTVTTFGAATATSGTVGLLSAPVTRFTFAVSAVPEPATWAMMLLGFGTIGGAARYRRRKTNVAFA